MEAEIKYRRAEEVAWREVSGEAVLVRPDSNVYVVLNRLGSLVWAAIENPRSAARLAEDLAGEYDVDPETLERDVGAFLAELEERRLVAREEDGR